MLASFPCRGATEPHAGRARTSGGRVEARHGRGAGEALVEAEAVVDVVDVAAGDAKVALNLGRRERECVRHLAQARKAYATAPYACKSRGSALVLANGLQALFRCPGDKHGSCMHLDACSEAQMAWMTM